jgi:hypothetical protein
VGLKNWLSVELLQLYGKALLNNFSSFDCGFKWFDSRLITCDGRVFDSPGRFQVVKSFKKLFTNDVEGDIIILTSNLTVVV